MLKKYCLVKNCRFPMTHITEGHRCNKCNTYGHGQIECGNSKLMMELSNNVLSSKIELPKKNHCNIIGCATNNTHTKESHICSSCNQREKCNSNCKENCYTINCPTCRKKNTISQTQNLVVGTNIECIICSDNKANVFFPECGHVNVCVECVNKLYLTSKHNSPSLNDNNTTPLPIISEIGHNPQYLFNIGFDGIDNYEEQIKEAKKILDKKRGKIFFCSYAGMGCYLFVKRNDLNSDIEIFFMHSDSWGQYGISDVSELNEFVDGYELVKNI
jgi:hypothetical protein